MVQPSAVSQADVYPYHPRYAAILQHNPVTNEPFIVLPAPHSNIRLTPARLDDADAILPIMNSPEVAMNCGGPPYPYLREHCDAWLRDRVHDYEKAMVDIRNAQGDAGHIDAFPLRHIREVAPDGTETFLGDIGLTREGAFLEIQGVEARAARACVNQNLPPGDPDIVWTMGDYLRPSHHKRGIMSAVVKTLIESWAVPHMNARKFYATTFSQNIPSQKVFLKNGFRLDGTLVGAVQFPENKGGHLVDLCYWSREVPESSTA